MTDNQIDLLDRFLSALRRLEKCPEFARLIPEVRTNLAYAPPDARGSGDVLAVDGRITVVDGLPAAAGEPRFGASDHMARLIIEVGRREPSFRAGINFASTPKLIAWLADYAKRQGWVLSVIDRSREPDSLKAETEPSIPWKVAEAIRAAGGQVPQLFHETAAVGKEPLTFLVGPDPVVVVEQACDIARSWSQEVSSRFCTRWAPEPGSGASKEKHNETETP